MNIAILGATSHIAKGLIFRFLGKGGVHLNLYTRSSSRMLDFLGSIEKISSEAYLVHQGYSDFFSSSHDVIINCVGVGTRKKIKGDYSLYFTITEKYDNMVIDYLLNANPDTLYISFSSGAVYGRGNLAPVEECSQNAIQVNRVAPADYYGITRLNAEAKHRAFDKLNIVDLRIFSYFSRYIDLADGYFITDVINSILHEKVFETSEVNICRDYVHPDDLFSMVLKCLGAGRINAAFDVNSNGSVCKQEILDYFSVSYGLNYVMKRSLNNISPTGSKNIYCSINQNASVTGYQPQYSSIETIVQEAEYILLPE